MSIFPEPLPDPISYCADHEAGYPCLICTCPHSTMDLPYACFQCRAAARAARDRFLNRRLLKILSLFALVPVLVLLSWMLPPPFKQASALLGLLLLFLPLPRLIVRWLEE